MLCRLRFVPRAHQRATWRVGDCGVVSSNMFDKFAYLYIYTCKRERQFYYGITVESVDYLPDSNKLCFVVPSSTFRKRYGVSNVRQDELALHLAWSEKGTAPANPTPHVGLFAVNFQIDIENNNGFHPNMIHRW